MASEPRRDLPARPAPSAASGGRQAPLADALAALAARVDALGAATTSFRSVVGERLVDLATEVARASDATGRRVADGQRAASSALVGIEAALRETEAALAHLDAVAAALVTRVDDLAEELADVVVTSVRQGVEAAFDEVAGRVAGGTGPAVPPVAGGGGAAPAPVVDLTPVLDALDTLDAGLAEVVARPAVADLSPVADRLDALATGVAEVAALAGAAAHPSPPDLTPVTVRLDALAAGVAEVADRLPTVDLGSVADRLAAQIGGQGDRPEPALSSLAPLQGRLDELLELVADLAAATPDPGGPAILLGRLDELADMVA
ncbi:MAG TPA: hypothetical protein VFP61_03830, partial [Acidimicrobiales bacterium]|nr:hypothetical protein [Acidimicrobiales bacterium]